MGGSASAEGGVRNSGAKFHLQVDLQVLRCRFCVIGTARATSFPVMGYQSGFSEKGNLS
jgi:hypothetical protein